MWQDAKLTLTSALTAVAAVMLASSGALGGFSREWWSGLLVNGGVAVLLVAPIYVLNKRLDGQLAQVRAEASARDDVLTERVAAIEEDVSRRVDELAAAVTQRVAREREQDVEVFEQVASAPSREVVIRALRRADELGILAERTGPRVLVSDPWDLYVRLDYQPADDMTDEADIAYFIVEHADGRPLDALGWYSEISIDDILVQLGRLLQKHSSPTTSLDVERMLSDFSEMLMVASRSARFRPILQLCPPQWAVTGKGIISYDRFSYELRLSQLRRPQIEAHMATKPWVHMDSFEEARAAALQLLSSEPF